MANDGGDWTVIQRRVDGSTNFSRLFTEYRAGFGNLEKEFWLGNEHMHLVTTQARYELRIDMTDVGGETKYVTYNDFRVEHGFDNYRLFLDGFSTPSNLTDRLKYHKHRQFTASDTNQAPGYPHCAQIWHGGWWFGHCHEVYLNGVYGAGNSIRWYQWSNDLRFVEMKIRRLQLY